MPDEKLDRRVARTRRLLREALIALIQEKGFSTLTVQDITDRADINRVTFYFHYKDKEDLLYHVLNEMYSELDEKAQAAETLEAWNQLDALHGFQHIAEYADLYRALWSKKGMLSFLGRLIDLLAHTSMKAEQARLQVDVQSPIPLEIFEYYCAGAFVGLSRWWLEHETAYSAEQMADMYYQIALKGGAWAMGVDKSAS